MTLNMMTDRAAIGLYPNKAETDVAVSKLLNIGIPVQGISVVGGARPAHEAALGNYTPPEFVERGLQIEEEREGVFVGGALGLLVGFGIYVVAGIGSLLVLGPLAGLLAGAGLGVTLGEVFGGGTFYGVAADYRKQLVAGNYLVFVEFLPELQGSVREILENTPSQTDPNKPLVTQSSP
jgi:hypothetical protein